LKTLVKDGLRLLKVVENCLITLDEDGLRLLKLVEDGLNILMRIRNFD